MVIAPDIAPRARTLVAPQRRAASTAPARTEPGYCRRCDSKLIMGYDEPECLTCGHADYIHTRDILPRWRRTSIVSTATRYVIRYVGDSTGLTDVLTHVRLVRRRYRAVYAVSCPFCQKSMEESSLSGKRPEAREQRFKCTDGHRVSLVPRKNGMLGWR